MNKKGKFLAGAVMGLGLGFLFAPKKGSETRTMLKEKMDELLKKVSEVDAGEVKESVETKIAEIKKQLEELDKETALKMAKKKAKEIQGLAEDLVDYAVDKGTPILEKMASSINETAIKATKEVLAKLEKEEKAE